MAPNGVLALNPGMCFNQESNQQPFDLQPMLNPLSHTSQGSFSFFYLKAVHVFWSEVGLL